MLFNIQMTVSPYVSHFWSVCSRRRQNDFFFACIWINFSTYQKNSRWDCCVKMCTTSVDVTIGLSSAAAHVTSRIAISFYGRAEALSPKLVTKNIMVNECEVIFFCLCQIYIKYNSYNCQSHDHNNLKLIN